MHGDVNTIRAELCRAGQQMFANQLAWGNAGNISARVIGDRYLISASGTQLGDLSAEDLVECQIGQAGFEGRKPSKERPMHEAIYAERPEIGAVLHASPFYSTLLACTAEAPPASLFVESMYYLERVAGVPYYHPGSQALGQAVRAQARNANVLLLENHGVLVYDISVREALLALQTLEFASRMWLAARSAGVELRGLSPSTVQEFLTQAGYKPRREWPE